MGQKLPGAESMTADLDLLPLGSDDQCATFGDVPWYRLVRLKLHPFKVAKITAFY